MFNIFESTALAAMAVNLALGVVVLLVNPRRRINRFFFIACACQAFWLTTLLCGSAVHDKQMQMFWIRQASVSVFMVLMVFDMMRLAIVHAEARGGVLFKEILPWLALVLLVGMLSQMPFFLHDVTVSPETGFPRPEYGHGQKLYVLSWIFALVLLGWRYGRELKRATGIERAELEFCVLAIVSGAITGVGLGQALPLITGNQDLTQFMPLASIQVSGIIAYGMVTRRIMSVNEVLRRTSAYILLAAYLMLLYAMLDVLVERVLSPFTAHAGIVAHFVATVAVVLSVVPAHGRMQRVANRLFINVKTLDAPSALRGAQEVLMSIGTTHDLLTRFADIVTKALGCDHVMILMEEQGTYTQAYPNPEEDVNPLQVAGTDPVVRLLRYSDGPVTLDGLRRMRPDPLRREAIRRLEHSGAAVAAPIRAEGKVEGVLLMGRRLSGRIYSMLEQDSLGLLCNQLGVALENAKLYTAVQDSKVYNDILLDNIGSGVMAIDADGRVAFFNREAQRIVAKTPEAVLGREAETLPGELASILRATLQRGKGERDLEVDITIDGDSRYLRATSSLLHSYRGETLGALLVVHDVTEMHRLQEQIRRSDRLASMGTLSAGMAHEIKNPLVTIKTFTQLLPERYEDPEFRKSFQSLVGEEVKRIDGIVSQLLTFARPSKPVITEIRVQDVLDKSLRLVEQQLRRKNIHVERRFTDKDDTVHGDGDLLSQAFVNFFLNAQEAMEEGGLLTVSTEVSSGGSGPLWWRAVRGRAYVVIGIRDTGMGIKADDVSHIFDPFFTTKTHGTGLGLSVAHGIIEEQRGLIDVESEWGKGTTLWIRFPRLRKQRSV
ncbi:MAG: PAS domain-containing protein [Lentisphaerae bacterium]|nr:PAS domain-containing protein [Lentisphaerota bacterium]